MIAFINTCLLLVYDSALQETVSYAWLCVLFPNLLAKEMSEVAEPPPTGVEEMAEENGTVTEVPVCPEPDSVSVHRAAEDVEGGLPADFERLWKAANDNPQDFTSWTDLLQYCEQEVCLSERKLQTVQLTLFLSHAENKS